MAASIPAATKEPKKTAIVNLISIDPVGKARALPEQFNANNGEPRLARDAVARGADGKQIPITVVGTTSQWSYFNGSTVEGRYVESSTAGVYKWYFSPVASREVTDEAAF